MATCANCGGPRDRGNFCKSCYPVEAAAVQAALDRINESEPEFRAHPDTMIGRQ